MTTRSAALGAIIVVVALASAGPAASQATFECGGLEATIVGTEGDDPSSAFATTPGQDVVVGLGGDDDIRGLGGDDLICGGGGQDDLSGDEGADLVQGDDGDDFIEGGPDDDRMNGGDGFDATDFGASDGVTVDLEAETASGAEGQDDVVAIEIVLGSDGDDALRGDEFDNFFIGYAGDDEIDGRDGGVDLVSYAPAEGRVIVNLTGGSAFGGGIDDDTLAGLEGVIGSDYSDTLTGDGLADVLNGRGGDDLIFGRAGDDALIGGEGSDDLLGGAGFADLAYSDRDAAVQADLEAGSLRSGSDSDSVADVEGIVGTPFDDVLVGDSADNILIGGDGDDLMDGRGGADFAAYAFTVGLDGLPPETGPVRVDLRAGTGWNYGDQAQTVGDTLVRIEDVLGAASDDTLIGDFGSNAFDGGAGDDTLRGSRGDDFFVPGVGDDKLYGGQGNGDAAAYFFGPGIYANLARHRIGVASAPARLEDAGEQDGVRGVEIVLGSAEDDVLRGSAERDILLGSTGDDKIYGRDGSDVLKGYEGADRVDGGKGHDYCRDGPRFECEAKNVPPELRDELRKAIEALDDIKRQKGQNRAF